MNTPPPQHVKNPKNRQKSSQHGAPTLPPPESTQPSRSLLSRCYSRHQRLLPISIQPALIAAETAVTIDQRPLHERVWEVEREREHKLRLLQAEREKQEGTTFAPPPLGRVSERLARDARPPVAAAAATAAAAVVATATTAATAVAAGGTEWGVVGGGRGMSRLKQQAMWARERRRKRVQEHEEV